MAVRKQADQIKTSELEKALRQLQSGKAAEDVLKNLARGLTNKLLHSPTVQLRKASAEGRNDILEMAQELYQLSEPKKED